MQTTFRFKLRLNKAQFQQLIRWQILVAYVKNRMIGDRMQTREQQSIMGDYCALHNCQVYTVSALRCDLAERFISSGLCCSINKYVSLGSPWKTGEPQRARPKKHKSNQQQKSPGIKRTPYQHQASFLPTLRGLKLELLEVNAFVLQKAVNQTDAAFQKFYTGVAKYPTFTSARSVGFEFDPGGVVVNPNRGTVKLPSLGVLRFYNSRDWWDGLKTAKTTITREADGFYISILVKDETIPAPIPPDKLTTITGGDMGIKKLLSLPGKTQFKNPRPLEKKQRVLKIRQRRVSRKKQRSANRRKAANCLSRLHQTIRRQREDNHNKVAKSFVSVADIVAVENLNNKGMRARCQPKKDENGKYVRNGQSAKAKLNQLLSDASFGLLREKIESQCQKQGKHFVAVHPKFTSQECPKCHYIDKSNRDGEKFLCCECSHFDDADNNSGLNIAVKGLQQLGLDLIRVRVVSSEFTPKITVRRHQPHGRLSRGSVKFKALPEKRILNMPQRSNQPVRCSDSKTIASA